MQPYTLHDCVLFIGNRDRFFSWFFYNGSSFVAKCRLVMGVVLREVTITLKELNEENYIFSPHRFIRIYI